MRAGVAAALLPVLTLLAVPAVALYEHRPPPGHTGGFSEPSCASCHFDHDLNEPGGSLEIRGLPEAYTPGERYLLSIVLRNPELRRGGFQLAIRDAGGAQAGELGVRDAGVEVVEAGGVRYAQHTRTGSRPVDAGVARWTVVWLAPDRIGEVTLNVAANAANGDASEFGDRVYLRELRVGEVARSGASGFSLR